MMTNFLKNAKAAMTVPATGKPLDLITAGVAKFLPEGLADVKIKEVDMGPLAEGKSYFTVTVEAEDGATHREGIFPIDKKTEQFGWAFRHMLASLMNEDGLAAFLDALDTHGDKVLTMFVGMKLRVKIGYNPKDLGLIIKLVEEGDTKVFGGYTVGDNELATGLHEDRDGLLAEMEEREQRRAYRGVREWIATDADANTAQFIANLEAIAAPAPAAKPKAAGKKSKLDGLV